MKNKTEILNPIMPLILDGNFSRGEKKGMILEVMQEYAEEFSIAKDKWVVKNVARLARSIPSSDPDFPQKLVNEFKKTLE